MKEKKGVFWKAYGIVVAVLLLVIVAIWIVLWQFLAVYEKSRAEYKVDEIIEFLNNLDIDNLLDYIDFDLSEFENEEDFRKFLASDIEGEWTYSKKIGEYTKDEPVYNLIKDGTKKGVIYLTKEDKKGKFNTSIYKVESIVNLVSEPRTVTIKAPGNASVIVNDVTLSEDYITSNDEEVTDLEYVADYITTPTYTTYTLEGIYGDLNVVAIGGVSGNELSVENTSETEGKVTSYEYTFECSEDFINSVSQRVNDYIYQYVDYVINTKDATTVKNYTLSGSNARRLITNSAVAISWNGTPKSIDYGEFDISNYQQYTDNCFSVEASVTASIVTSSGETREYPTHMKLIWVKSNGIWYVVDFKLLNK